MDFIPLLKEPKDPKPPKEKQFKYKQYIIYPIFNAVLILLVLLRDVHLIIKFGDDSRSEQYRNKPFFVQHMIIHTFPKLSDYVFHWNGNTNKAIDEEVKITLNGTPFDIQLDKPKVFYNYLIQFLFFLGVETTPQSSRNRGDKKSTKKKKLYRAIEKINFGNSIEFERNYLISLGKDAEEYLRNNNKTLITREVAETIVNINKKNSKFSDTFTTKTCYSSSHNEN